MRTPWTAVMSLVSAAIPSGERAAGRPRTASASGRRLRIEIGWAGRGAPGPGAAPDQPPPRLRGALVLLAEDSFAGKGGLDDRLRRGLRLDVCLGDQVARVVVLRPGAEAGAKVAPVHGGGRPCSLFRHASSLVQLFGAQGALLRSSLPRVGASRQGSVRRRRSRVYAPTPDRRRPAAATPPSPAP